jgi:hypothetical protein
MEKRSRRRIRDLVARPASLGLSENEIGCARISMVARNTNVPFKGRIQKRKTYHLQIITFRLQRAAGPYRSATSRHMQCSKLRVIRSPRQRETSTLSDPWRAPPSIRANLVFGSDNLSSLDERRHIAVRYSAVQRVHHAHRRRGGRLALASHGAQRGGGPQIRCTVASAIASSMLREAPARERMASVCSVAEASIASAAGSVPFGKSP